MMLHRRVVDNIFVVKDVVYIQTNIPICDTHTFKNTLSDVAIGKSFYVLDYDEGFVLQKNEDVVIGVVTFMRFKDRNLHLEINGATYTPVVCDDVAINDEVTLIRNDTTSCWEIVECAKEWEKLPF